MDCEKFDQYVMDALYGELDELTLEALKRHVEGCARCGPVWSGLKSTRSAVTLPLEEPDAGLEERILAAERSVQHTAPIHRKIMRAAAWAGSVVMRPQFAMAAVFMLVVGSSLMLLRGRPNSMAPPLQVSEQGRPEAPQATAQPESRGPVGAAPAKAAAAEEKERDKDRGSGREESDRLREDGLMDNAPPPAGPNDSHEGGVKNEPMATAAAPTAPTEAMTLNDPCDLPNLEKLAKGGGDQGVKAAGRLAECQKLSYAKAKPSSMSSASARPTAESTVKKPGQ